MEHLQRCKLLASKEISRQGRKVACSGIGIPLTSGTVESHNDDRATPRLFGLCATSYALDSIVDRRSQRQRERAIEVLRIMTAASHQRPRNVPKHKLREKKTRVVGSMLCLALHLEID